MKIVVAALVLICGLLPAWAQQAQTGWLGVGSEDLTQEEAEKLGLKAPRGAKLTGLSAGGPADSAGLKSGDIVVSLDQAEVVDSGSFNEMLWSRTPGTAIKLAIRRDGSEKQFTITLGARPFKQLGNSPRLMLDTGGHMAAVISLAVTPDGSQLVSASNDKTVRVWDVATGRTLRIIRGEATDGNWGAIYAMALSPDGHWLATGGYLSEADPWTASGIRLYDFPSGTLVATLKGHKNVVSALAFSTDSKRLISGSGDKSAIIWDVTAKRELMRLAGHAKRVGAVAFSIDGARAVTGSDDGTLRIWNTGDGKQIAELKEHQAAAERDLADAEQRAAKYKLANPPRTGVSVESVAFSPTEDLFASSSSDGRILLWDAQTGDFVRALANPGGMIGFSAIASIRFSPDGKWLLGTSEFQGCSLYNVASGAEMINGKLHQESPTFMDDVRRERCGKGVAFAPDGTFAAAGYNSQIKILDARANRLVKTLLGSGATIQTVGVAPDAKTIAWGNRTKKDEKLARLLRRLHLPGDGVPIGAAEDMAAQTPAGSAPAPGSEDYLRGSTRHGPWSVGFRPVNKTLINTRYVQISKDGEVQAEIDLGHGNLSGNSPMSFTADGKAVLIGAIPEIRAFDLSGKELGSFIGHGGMLRDLAPSADGRFLVSGSADQTVRLWNLKTRELIVSIFDGADGEWVVWTPQGYYASSPNGDRIVGWQINNGPDRAADYVAASQLRKKFYRPDIVDRAIILASAKRAVEEAETGRPAGFQLSDLPRRLPPKIAVLSPRDGSQTSNGRASIELALAETAGDPVNQFDVYVNDIKVTPGAKRDGDQVSLEVPLGQGDNRVRLVARSKADLLGEARVDIVQRGEGALDKRDTLYIVAVGADKYPKLPKSCGQDGKSPCDLAFAGADARTFAGTVEKQMGRQHLRVVKRVLVNGAGGELEPTRANVENAFDLLLKSKDNDTVAVFIAGHGVNDTRSGYQFLPTDARFGDGSNLASSSVIKWAVLEGAIQSAKGRRLLFVDTCRSTNAFNPRLMKDASDDAIVAFSATNTQQDALELPTLGHGVFTNAVVNGLNGAADIAHEQEVRVFDLGAYVEREVRKLTKGLQTPDFYKKPGAENFILVRMSDETAAIPTAATNSAAGDARPPRQETRSERPAETSPATAPEKPAEKKPAAQPSQPPALIISPNEEAVRLKRGEAALALNDVAAARLIFEYLANHGSAAGAYQLARTYDPQIQARNPAGAAFRPDAKMAKSWYLRAAELGHAEAQKKIAAEK